MKNKSIILLLILLVILFISLLSGCSKTVNDLKTGVYSTTDGMSHLTIDEADKTFIFQRGITSYRPSGNYTIKGDKLLLHVNEDIIEFEINGDTLIFESGELAEDLIKKGTEFLFIDLSPNDKAG